MALQTPMERRARQVRNGWLQGIEASEAPSSGNNVCRRKATTVASSASVRIVERGSFGPVLRSSTVWRLRHFATVFGLMPRSRLNVASEACDHSGQPSDQWRAGPSLLQL